MTVDLVPTLTDEQAMLVEASERFMEDQMPIAVVRAVIDGAPRDDDGYRTLAAELGWLGLLAGEAAGGGSASGNGLLDAAIVAAERGARVQPGPFTGHGVVTDALARVGGDAQAAVLADLASGAAWASWAFDGAERCRIDRAGDGYRLTGTLPVLAEADLCAHLLVAASGPAGTTQVLVPLDADGVDLHRLESLDVTRRWFRVELDVALDATAVVGDPGDATRAAIERQAQVAAVLDAADAVGAMHADFEMALQYAKDRVAFGRPIGSFQALKHVLADASLAVEMSKAIVAMAASTLGADGPDGAQLAHAAKSFVAERSIQVMHDCFQVFAGIGFTWEHDQHLFLRRMSADAVASGSAPWHRARLLDLVEAGR